MESPFTIMGDGVALRCWEIRKEGKVTHEAGIPDGWMDGWAGW